MKELLLKYALNLFGFKQDRANSNEYYLEGTPHKDYYVWYDVDYDAFFKRDFTKEDHCDELLQFEKLEELQQYILNIK